MECSLPRSAVSVSPVDMEEQLGACSTTVKRNNGLGTPVPLIGGDLGNGAPSKHTCITYAEMAIVG